MKTMLKYTFHIFNTGFRNRNVLAGIIKKAEPLKEQFTPRTEWTNKSTLWFFSQEKLNRIPMW